MPAAVLSVGPMPEPVSRYQLPLAPATSMPAFCQSASSALWVPLSSPREANGALAAAILVRASSASLLPLMPAGSAAGPTITKSLYITSWRSTPKPSATNCSSDGLWCTNSTSASPFFASSIAWPVPTATTRTSIPVFFLELRQQLAEQPGVLGRGGRGDGDELVLSEGGAEAQAEPRCEQGSEQDGSAVHGFLSLGCAA